MLLKDIESLMVMVESDAIKNEPVQEQLLNLRGGSVRVYISGSGRVTVNSGDYIVNGIGHRIDAVVAFCDGVWTLKNDCTIVTRNDRGLGEDKKPTLNAYARLTGELERAITTLYNNERRLFEEADRIKGRNLHRQLLRDAAEHVRKAHKLYQQAMEQR